MAKYFFPIIAKDTVIPDWEGTELPDLAATHLHALKIIHESMFYVSSEPIWQGWMVKIIDERGANLLTVLYPNRLWTNHQMTVGALARVGMSLSLLK
jgi:hypothetical protein